MSTTVVQPREVPSGGFSKKTIGMIVAGVLVALGVGFAIANEPAGQTAVDAESASMNESADRVLTQRSTDYFAGELTPSLREGAHLVIEPEAAPWSAGELTPSVSETANVVVPWSAGEFTPSVSETADLLHKQRAAEYYAGELTPTVDESADIVLRQRATESGIGRQQAIELAAALVAERQLRLIEATKGVDLSPELGVSVWESRVDFLTEQFRVRAQENQALAHESKADYLFEQYKAQQDSVAQELEALAWESKAEFLAEQYKAQQSSKGSGLISEAGPATPIRYE